MPVSAVSSPPFGLEAAVAPADAPISSSADERPLRSAVGWSQRTLRRVFALLERCERQSGAGVLALTGPSRCRGSFVLLHRRACLVTLGPPGWQGLLAAADSEGAEMLRQLGARARSRGQRLEAVITEAGQAAADRIRAVLLEESARSLVRLVEGRLQDESERPVDPLSDLSRWRFEWRPVEGVYPARLTFSMLQLYEAATLLLEAPPAAFPGRLFDEHASACELALLLWEDPLNPSSPVPIRAAGPRITSLAGVRSLAQAVASISSPAELEHEPPRVVAFGSPWSQCVVVREGALRAALVGHDAESRALIAQRVFSREAR